jgi:hypothetical protein
MRTAFQYLARNLDVRLARVVAGFLAAATRILRDAACLGGVGLVSGRVPVDRPFPDIADHVIEAITVLWKRLNRRGALGAVFGEVLERKGANRADRRGASVGERPATQPSAHAAELGVVLWVRRNLRKGDIGGRFDELSEVPSWLPA